MGRHVRGGRAGDRTRAGCRPASGRDLHGIRARLARWGFGDADVSGGGVSTTEVPCGVVRLSVGRVELPALAPRAAPGVPCP